MLLLALVLPFVSVADETEVSKIEWLVSKYNISSKIEDYSLYCKIIYNSQYQPEKYTFVFRAQNEEYEVLEDRFVICLGDAQKMYDTLSACINFAENVKESGLTFETNGVALENTKVPLFGWFTYIEIDGNYHGFRLKELKNLMAKFETFCKKQGLQINKKQD